MSGSGAPINFGNDNLTGSGGATEQRKIRIRPITHEDEHRWGGSFTLMGAESSGEQGMSQTYMGAPSSGKCGMGGIASTRMAVASSGKAGLMDYQPITIGQSDDKTNEAILAKIFSGASRATAAPK